MRASMEAVAGGKMSITAVATHYNVARKTLDDRVKGKVKRGTKPGITTVLTTEEDANYHIYYG